MITEARIAVVNPSGARSTVWKFWSHDGSVYVASRMFGGDVKVSIHGSGECQLSRPGEWAKANNRPNAERHLHKWKAALPLGTAAEFVFEVRIPSSELRPISVDEDLADVQWRDAAPKGYATAIQCFISPPASFSAVATAIPADSLQMVLPFADGRWFVGRHTVMHPPRVRVVVASIPR